MPASRTSPPAEVRIQTPGSTSKKPLQTRLSSLKIIKRARSLQEPKAKIKAMDQKRASLKLDVATPPAQSRHAACKNTEYETPVKKAQPKKSTEVSPKKEEIKPEVGDASVKENEKKQEVHHEEQPPDEAKETEDIPPKTDLPVLKPSTPTSLIFSPSTPKQGSPYTASICVHA